MPAPKIQIVLRPGLQDELGKCKVKMGKHTGWVLNVEKLSATALVWPRCGTVGRSSVACLSKLRVCWQPLPDSEQPETGPAG